MRRQIDGLIPLRAGALRMNREVGRHLGERIGPTAALVSARSVVPYAISAIGMVFAASTLRNLDPIRYILAAHLREKASTYDRPVI